MAPFNLGPALHVDRELFYYTTASTIIKLYIFAMKPDCPDVL